MGEFVVMDGGVTEPLFDGLNEDNLEEALLDATEAVEVTVEVKPKRTRRKAEESEAYVPPTPGVGDILSLMLDGIAPVGHYTDVRMGELPNQVYVTCTPLVTNDNGTEVPDFSKGSRIFTFFVREV